VLSVIRDSKRETPDSFFTAGRQRTPSYLLEIASIRADKTDMDVNGSQERDRERKREREREKGRKAGREDRQNLS